MVFGSDELRQQVIHLGIVDILLKKLEVGDRHEVRMSLICLDILGTLGKCLYLQRLTQLQQRKIRWS